MVKILKTSKFSESSQLWYLIPQTFCYERTIHNAKLLTVTLKLQISLNRTRRTLYVNFRYRRHIFLTANMYPSKGFARFTLEHDPRWWHMCPRDDQRYYTKTLMEDTEIRRIKESVDAMDDDGYGIQRWLAVLMWCAAMTLFNRNLWFKHRRFYQRTAMYARSKLFSSKGNPIEKYLVCFSGFDEHVSTMCLGRYYRVPVHGKIYFMVGVRRTRLLTYGQGQRMRRNLESLPSLDVPAFPRGPMEFIFHDHPRGAVLYNSSW